MIPRQTSRRSRIRRSRWFQRKRTFAGASVFVAHAAVAEGARGSSWTPMYQAIRWNSHTSGVYSYQVDTSWVHPSFFLLFGFYRAITVPEQVTAVAGSLELGEDLWHEMLPLQSMPVWDHNDIGSPLLQNLGHIKMMKPNWERWFDGCFQTCVWMGTSTPSQNSQRKYAEQGKGECKGKGKRTWKGECKGKGKHKWKGK